MCTLIALHHGRKTKSESLEYGGIHCLLPSLRNLIRVFGPARLLLFLRDKVALRDSERNENCSLAQESTHLIK